jgi:hypothetical protein
MIPFAQIWDLLFSSFVVFVGVGLIWLGFIESQLPSRGLSVTLMIIVALAAAVARFYFGYRRAVRDRLAAEAQIEAAYTRYEEEIG